MLPLFYLIKRNAEVHFRTNIFKYLRKKYLNQLYTCTFILSTQILYFYNNVHRRWKKPLCAKIFLKDQFWFISVSECMPGSFGTNCTLICPFPTYGKKCQNICHCDNKTCNAITGCTTQTTGT